MSPLEALKKGCKLGEGVGFVGKNKLLLYRRAAEEHTGDVFPFFVEKIDRDVFTSCSLDLKPCAGRRFTHVGDHDVALFKLGDVARVDIMR